MNFLAFLRPKPTISDHDINLGLRWYSFHGMTATGLFSITTSGILVAFALALGANNLQIGVLAALLREHVDELYVYNYEMDEICWWHHAEEETRFEELKQRFKIR